MMLTVRQARRFANKTQTQMAEDMGICRTTYARLEANPDAITIAHARKISEITGVPLDELFFDSNSTNSRERDAV